MIEMMQEQAGRNRAVGLLPINDGAKFPDVRLGHLHERPLIIMTPKGADANSANRRPVHGGRAFLEFCRQREMPPAHALVPGRMSGFEASHVRFVPNRPFVPGHKHTANFVRAAAPAGFAAPSRASHNFKDPAANDAGQRHSVPLHKIDCTRINALRQAGAGTMNLMARERVEADAGMFAGIKSGIK